MVGSYHPLNGRELSRLQELVMDREAKAVGDWLELEHQGTAVFGEELNLIPST